MTVAALFQDPVAHQVAFLKSRFPDLSVSALVPNPRPVEFVTVERDGGSEFSPAHDRPMITYRVVAATVLDAGELMEKVRQQVRSQPEFFNTVGGPVFLPDPDDGLPRYQLTVQLTLRGK